MNIDVEFYGIPGRRAGVAGHRIELDNNRQTLGDLLQSLSKQFPDLRQDCIDGVELQSGCVANLGGERFVRDPNTVLHPGDCVLIMSADAGG